MVSEAISDSLRLRLTQHLEQAKAGSCFVPCLLASFTSGALRCQLSLSERRIRFMMLVSRVLDENGERISFGQLVKAWEKGWVLGEIASRSEDHSQKTLVRFYQPNEDPLEVEVNGHEVISIS